MDDQPTCGKGLAENSALPLAMSALADAMAAVLETHMKALDPNSPVTRKELDVYADLAQRHRAAAVELTNTAAEMACHRDMPMGKHDMAFMTSAEPREVFKKFVEEEQALAELLGRQLERDRQMLRTMTGVVG